MTPFISIEDVRTNTRTGSVSAIIRVTPFGLRVDEKLAAAILALHPTLAQHACKQQGFGRFGDKLSGTTLPHLVEHLAIDLLVNATHHPHAGTTTWLDREQGLMRVRVSRGSVGGDADLSPAANAGAPGVVGAAALAATGTAPHPASPPTHDTEMIRTALRRAVTLLNSLHAQ
jgi:hypothetical protein